MKTYTFGKAEAAIKLVEILEKYDKKVNKKTCRYLALTKNYCKDFFICGRCSIRTPRFFEYLYNLFHTERINALKQLNLPDDVYRFTRNVATGYLRGLYRYHGK